MTYAVLLWITLARDTKYWREKGALLLSYRTLERFVNDDKVEYTSCTKIPMSDVRIIENIGAGASAAVYKATWYFYVCLCSCLFIYAMFLFILFLFIYFVGKERWLQ